MLQPGGELDFPEEAIGTEGLSQFRMEHLECDRAIVAQVLRQIHDRHPTAAELALDAIVGRQLRLETIQTIRQVDPEGKSCSYVTLVSQRGKGAGLDE
jgi:Tfp pilus assembly ATPase PilU